MSKSVIELNGQKWIEEHHSDFLNIRYKIENVLFSGQSDFQSVEVVETKGYGRMLVNDSLVMMTERDEFIYHEMISHVPIHLHPNPKKVLIIGGGDGGTAREVLRHPGIEKVVMVEIDKMVVDASKEFLPITADAMSNPRLELHIDDGINYVAQTKEKFDCVLVDSTDPVGPSKPLFGEQFFRNVDRCTSPNGIIVAQAESPFYFQETQTVLLQNLAKVFPVTTLYNFTNLTYPGGLWSFAYASKGIHPINDFDVTRVAKSNLKMKYYNAMVHTGSFALPQFMLDHLGASIKI